MGLRRQPRLAAQPGHRLPQRPHHHLPEHAATLVLSALRAAQPIPPKPLQTKRALPPAPRALAPRVKRPLLLRAAQHHRTRTPARLVPTRAPILKLLTQIQTRGRRRRQRWVIAI